MAIPDTQRDYNRPIHSQKVIPDNYDRDDKDYEKNYKVNERHSFVVESG